MSTAPLTGAAALDPASAGPDLVIQDLATTHDRQVTATSGTVQRGRWHYPARVFDGVTQYQTRAGEWLDLPADEPDPTEE